MCYVKFALMKVSDYKPTYNPRKRPVATVEVISDLQQCEDIAGEWAALDAIGLCEPCTSLEWTRALLQSYVEDTDRFMVLVLRVDRRILAIVPAVIRRERVLGPFGEMAFCLLSDMISTHSDVLRGSNLDSIVTPLFDAIRALPYRWDVLRIRRLLECNPLSVQITNCLSRSELAHRRRRANPSYIPAPEHGYEGFLASRSEKFRNHLRRRTRMLESAGHLDFRRAGREIAVDEAYTHLLEIEQRSWKHANGTAISAVPRQREFYRLLCEGVAHRGRLHLLLMYLDGRPIAYNLGITAADRYSYLKTNFVEDLRQLCHGIASASGGESV